MILLHVYDRTDNVDEICVKKQPDYIRRVIA
jgi:hypothetical protein